MVLSTLVCVTLWGEQEARKPDALALAMLAMHWLGGMWPGRRRRRGTCASAGRWRSRWAPHQPNINAGRVRSLYSL